MNLENINNLLTLIVTNDSVKTKNDTHLFTYQKTDKNTHSDTFDNFIQETNLNLENTYYFDTALELTKMGHLILCNIPDTNYLLIFCPDLNKITKTQKCFLSLIQDTLKNFDNITVALYNEEQDQFFEHIIDGIDMNSKDEILVKKLKNNR